MTEQEFIQRLRQIERAYAGAKTVSDHQTAASIQDRLRAILEKYKREEGSEEFKFSLTDVWSHRLFTALLRRYDIQPYRYRGQKHTTVMARMPQSFLDATLWPQFTELSDTLNQYISEITNKMIAEHIHRGPAETAVVDKDRRLGF